MRSSRTCCASGQLKGETSTTSRTSRSSTTSTTGAARPQAVPARQGLHRPQRRGRHHRRVHRPHDAGPPLFGRPAPGAGSQGTRQDPAGEPDAGLDHLPELFPHVQEARRHDRHGATEAEEFGTSTSSTSSTSRPTCRSAARTTTTRSIRTAEKSSRRSPTDRELPQARPAGAGRHDLDREVGNAGRTAAQEGHSRTFRVLNARYHEQEAFIVAQAGVPGAVTIATNMAGRGTDIQLGGNARHAHRAGTRRPPKAIERDRRSRDQGARSPRKAIAGRRRPVRDRHRAPREPPHRQPAARPFRPPGRPRPLEVLPVAAGRPDAHLRSSAWIRCCRSSA
jgi:hypothetical protein